MTSTDYRLEILRRDLDRVSGASVDARRVLELLDGPGDVFSRYHYEPGHVTGSAFVAHAAEAAVALIHHAKLDLWVQPGGHVEPGDSTVEDGARREVTEEIGIEQLSALGVVDVDVHVFPTHGDQPTHRHFDVRYGFRAGSDRLVAGDGVHEARWVSVDEALSMDESVARAVRRMADLLGW